MLFISTIIFICNPLLFLKGKKFLKDTLFDTFLSNKESFSASSKQNNK